MRAKGKPNNRFKIFLNVQKKAAKVTSKQLAEKLQVTQPTFVKITQHLDECSLIELNLLAGGLKMPLEHLIESIIERSSVI